MNLMSWGSKRWETITFTWLVIKTSNFRVGLSKVFFYFLSCLFVLRLHLLYLIFMFGSHDILRKVTIHSHSSLWPHFFPPALHCIPWMHVWWLFVSGLTKLSLSFSFQFFMQRHVCTFNFHFLAVALDFRVNDAMKWVMETTYSWLNNLLSPPHFHLPCRVMCLVLFNGLVSKKVHIMLTYLISFYLFLTRHHNNNTFSL